MATEGVAGGLGAQALDDAARGEISSAGTYAKSAGLGVLFAGAGRIVAKTLGSAFSWITGGNERAVASAATEEIGAANAATRKAPFNPSGARNNCVNGVCAFLNSVKNQSLEVASTAVAENGGSIQRANAQIRQATGVRMGAVQSNTLNTARPRQFFVVYPGQSQTAAEHVLVGINNGGETMLYDPQTHAKTFDISSFGPFTAFPVAW